MKNASTIPSVARPWSTLYPQETVSLPICSAVQYMKTVRQVFEEDTAISYYATKISYRKFFEWIDAYAKAFTAMGVRRGDTVVLSLPTTPENVYAFYGLNRIGAVVDLVDLRAKGEVLDHYLREAKADVLMVCELFGEEFIRSAKALGIRHVVMVSPVQSIPMPIRLFLRKKKRFDFPGLLQLDAFLKQGAGVQLPPDTGKDTDIAVIMHTSGTTGRPKGVMMSNGSMNAMVLNYSFICDKVVRGETFMNQVPPFLAYNIIMATHMPLCARLNLRLLPEYRPDIFAHNVTKLKPNYVIAGPADWKNFLDKPEKCRDYSFLRVAASGSDSLQTDIMQSVNAFLQARGCTAEIIEGYGMTEIGAAAVTNLPGHVRPGTLGVPLPMNNICIYDSEAERECGYGESGEICLTGPTLMAGYRDAPEHTAEALRVHGDGQTWLHTGDLGQLDQDGFLHLEGRLKRIIVRFDGIKVSPFNIEKLVLGHGKVTSCCVVGCRDREHGSGQIAVVYFTMEGNDAEQVIGELRELCTAQLAENYRPADYRVLDALPLTPNGKVDYRSLED